MFLPLLALPFGHDHYISRDAGWCWFADPRAVWVDGKILAGGVTQAGDAAVSLYDPRTKTGQTAVLASAFERDDHDNPSFLPLKDGRMAAFFSRHSGKDLFLSVSEGSNLLKWKAPRAISPNDPSYKGPAGALNAYTYPTPVRLEGEGGKIWLFWRGMNWKPTFSTSTDEGQTWATGRILISPAGDSPDNRPYMKVASDGKKRILFAFTDGHPRNEPTNSIYFLEYRDGAFFTARGERVARLNQLPIRPQQADIAYDARSENARAWIWDVASDKEGHPVIVYSRLPKETEHWYRYVRWDGRRWVDRPIVFAGKWFPQTPQGQTEREPHYSGGLALDHADPRWVYLSRPVNGRFEIERWLTEDGGDSWSHVAVTGESKHDSVRPFVVRGERPVGGPNALWVNANKYIHYTDYQSTIQGANEEFGPYSPNQPTAAANAVFRWVRSNPSAYDRHEWMLAPLYAGVLEFGAWGGYSEMVDWVRQEGASIEWKMGPRKSMADDAAVAQAFLGLYELDHDPAQLAPAKAWLESFAAMPHTRGLEWKDGVHNEELAWCDSLFMAPPAMAMLSRITGDPKCLQAMDRLWWKTSDYLYDPAERLYFRDSRYFDKKEANSKKVFWSRGNGWVLAGLARVLQNMPRDYPSRPRFEQQFRDMAARIADLQTPDGTWHASLLDPASYPQKETSGTGFFVYAMAWGMNEGLLDRGRFTPAVRKGFAALCAALDANGRLGWVQPIGQDPKLVKASDTDAYGVGAFLLAAKEMARSVIR